MSAPGPNVASNPGAHHVEVDPDRGQGVAVEGAEEAGPRAGSDEAEDLLLDRLRGDTVLAQHSARWFADGGDGEQQMLTAELSTFADGMRPEPARRYARAWRSHRARRTV